MWLPADTTVFKMPNPYTAAALHRTTLHCAAVDSAQAGPYRMPKELGTRGTCVWELVESCGLPGYLRWTPGHVSKRPRMHP